MAAAVKDMVNSAVDASKRAFGTAPPTDAYLRWDSPGVEVIKPDEEAKTAQIVQVMNRLQGHNFDRHRHAFRATHIKTQGVVKGKLTVRDDLPTHMQQGMFSQPGKEYDVISRYANEPFAIQDDKETGPRGLSLKIFGVEGERLEDVPDTVTTQDFLFNNAPMLELTDVDTTLEIMGLREKHFDNPTALGAALKLRTDALKQHAPYQLPNTNIISHAMYTQSAFRYGDYYGHMALFPNKDSQKSHDEPVQNDAPFGILADWLFDYFKGQGASYDLKIQLGTSPLHHPTEDASIVWSEETAPYQTIATLTFPHQESFDPARRTYWEENLYLSPWRGLAAHRPLGSVNRLRKKVYQGSMTERRRLNATAGEPIDERTIKFDEIP